MAYMVVTGFRHRSAGNKRRTTGIFSATATGGEIDTGLKRVESFDMVGYDTTDNNYSIARNTTGTTDQAFDAMGTVHYSGAAASPSVYRFSAEGV